MVTKLHQATHLRASNIAELLRPRHHIHPLDNFVKDTVSRGTTYAQVNPKRGRNTLEGIYAQVSREQWKVDFIKPTVHGYKHLPVFIDTFSS